MTDKKEIDWRNYKKESEIAHFIPKEVEIDQPGRIKKKFQIKDDEGNIIYLKHLPVSVPYSYIKDKEYDGDEEIFSMHGIGLRLGEATIKPPCLGVFTMMEPLNNTFIINPLGVDPMKKFHVLFINEYRQAAAELCADVFYNPPENEFDPDNTETWSALDIASYNYVLELESKGVKIDEPATWLKIWKLFEAAAGGFEMLPPGGGSKWLYGAEMAGKLIAAVGSTLNKTFDQIMWETPLTTIGFAMAGKSIMNGSKDVRRPKCPLDVRRQRILAYLREIHGELHQWQIDRPCKDGLTKEQMKHPQCVEKFNRIRDKYIKDNGLERVKKK